MKNIFPSRLIPKKAGLQLGFLRRNRVTVMFRFLVVVTVRLVVNVRVKDSVEDEG